MALIRWHKQICTLLIGTLGAWFVAPSALQAHGALIEYSEAKAIRIQASFDTGHPMSDAQIAVFAPDNPMTPWLTGSADDQGVFSFVPAAGQTGTLSIQARLAGHGAMVHVPLESTRESDTMDQQPRSTSPYNTGQRLLMAASVIWGCIGTALYFLSRKKSDACP